MSSNDRVIIFDTTLRDGEQSPGASMTKEEKLRIAKEHLLPRQLGRHAIAEGTLTVTDEAILAIVRDYTREAGVRRQIVHGRRGIAVQGEGGTSGADQLGARRLQHLASLHQPDPARR